MWDAAAHGATTLNSTYMSGGLHFLAQSMQREIDTLRELLGFAESKPEILKLTMTARQVETPTVRSERSGRANLLLSPMPTRATKVAHWGWVPPCAKAYQRKIRWH